MTQDQINAEVFNTIAQILGLGDSEKFKAADLVADLFDKVGEGEFARRVREAKTDGDRLQQVFADIDAEAERRRAAYANLTRMGRI